MSERSHLLVLISIKIITVNLEVKYIILKGKMTFHWPVISLVGYTFHF